MVTVLITLLGLGLLAKVLKLIKDIALTILSVVGSLIGILVFFRLLFKWVLVPMAKGIRWLAVKFWLFLQWLGNKMDEHFTYRNDNQYWVLVATSKDRGVI